MDYAAGVVSTTCLRLQQSTIHTDVVSLTEESNNNKVSEETNHS